MNRNNQRGAVGTFVVVGAVLAAAALAVLYGARHSLSDQQNPPISSELVAADNKSDNKNNKSNKDCPIGLLHLAFTEHIVQSGEQVIDADYNHPHWLERMRGLEQEPERGVRCSKCFAYRLASAALSQ